MRGINATLTVILTTLLCGAFLLPARSTQEAPAQTAAVAPAVRRPSFHAACVKAYSWVVKVSSIKQGLYSKKEVFGAGIIVDARGYVLTNQHVVNDVLSTVAVLTDGSEVPVTVVVEDPISDLALLKLPSGKVYPKATFSQTDAVVGDEVIAVGHPDGYQNSISVAVVSALNRDVPLVTGNTLKHLIQTAIPLSPGGSGGPLLNLDGELVGVNVAGCREMQCLSFAISTTAVRVFLNNALPPEQEK